MFFNNNHKFHILAQNKKSVSSRCSSVSIIYLYTNNRIDRKNLQQKYFPVWCVLILTGCRGHNYATAAQQKAHTTLFFFLIFVKPLKSPLGGSRFEYETTSKKFMHTIMKLFITPGSERSVRNGVWQEKKKGVTSKGLNLFLNQTKAHTQLRIL